MFARLRNVKNPQAVIFGSVVTILGLTAYPAFGKKTREGHDFFSSEKPEAIRESQEAKRKEYRRLIKEQRKQHLKDMETFEKLEKERNQQ